MLPSYPQTEPLTLALRPLLHPLFAELQSGISEYTFANIFLFRATHHYAVSRLPDQSLILLGRDKDLPFVMFPFALPDRPLLDQVLEDLGMIKGVSRQQAEVLGGLGYQVVEDRNNFDYLYHRQDLALLAGRNYHKKRNLIKSFTQSYDCIGRPLDRQTRDHALQVLATWSEHSEGPGDSEAAREALVHLEELELCGTVFYIADLPVAYVLGEPLSGGSSYVIHFEKAVPGYKGLYQFVNQAFATQLPATCSTINREQDLGNPGLRQAKLSYFPAGFVEKFRVFSTRSR